MNRKRGTLSSNHCKKRAQASMEYLMIAGIAFVIIVPMMYILYQYTSDLSRDVTNTKLGKIGADIANTAEQIFYLGEPSRTTLRFDMPEGVYDIEVTGDRTIIFKLGDPSSPKEVTTFANVNIVSYLVPDDFTKGRKNLKIEAEKDHVILYTGDKESVLLKHNAYAIFKELMRWAEMVYGQKALVTRSGSDYSIKEDNKEDTAYIGTLELTGTLPNIGSLDISADALFNSLEGPVHFFIGDKQIIDDNTILSRALEIEIDSSVGFRFWYAGQSATDSTSYTDKTLIINPPTKYNLRIKTSLLEDCSEDSLCSGATEDGLYYIFIVSDAVTGNVQASAYILKGTADSAFSSGGFALNKFFFGDISISEGKADMSIRINPTTNFGPSDITSFEEKSSATTKSITTSVDILNLDIIDNAVSFNIDSGEVDGEGKKIGIPVTFRSYYPMINVIPLLEDYTAEESCFEFTLIGGSVLIEKTSCA